MKINNNKGDLSKIYENKIIEFRYKNNHFVILYNDHLLTIPQL